jgi:hypothetical protein
MPQRKQRNALMKRRKDDSDDEDLMLDQSEESEEAEIQTIIVETPKQEARNKRSNTALQRAEQRETATAELFEEQGAKRPLKKAKNANALTVKSDEQTEELEEQTEELEGQAEAATGKHLLTGEARVLHPELGKRSIEIGKTVRKKLDELDASDPSIKIVDDLIEHIGGKTKVPEDVLKSILGAKKRQFKPTKPQMRAFGSDYRKHKPGMDELLSTSTVRDLLRGMLNVTAKDDAVMLRVQKLVDLMSVVRVPTKYVGIVTKENQMQHPTGEDGDTGIKGLYEHSQRVNEHYNRDQDRRQYVVESMERAAKSGKGAADIIIEGLRAAIEATLKLMMAPISADDVSPYFQSMPTEQERREQNEWREMLKEIQQRLEGTPGSAIVRKPQKFNALWDGQKPSLQHTLSDFRIVPEPEPTEPQPNTIAIDPLPVSGLPRSLETEMM